MYFQRFVTMIFYVMRILFYVVRLALMYSWCKRHGRCMKHLSAKIDKSSDHVILSTAI